jgi:hypothetical protein
LHGLIIDRDDALIEVYVYLARSDLRCIGSLVRAVEDRTLMHHRSPAVAVSHWGILLAMAAISLL